MSGILSTPPAPALPPPPAPPGPSSADVQAKAAAERKRLAAQRGRASTILTGGQGVVDDGGVAKKTLLGE